MNSFQNLLDFLARLQATKIHYTLAHFREETISVEIAVPGERWEVEFFADGGVDVEVFTSSGQGELEGVEAFSRLFATHGA
ncbi:MAG: hypothetical protein ABJE47_10535 [bacterium]